MALKGKNGSGKTCLIQLVLGTNQPTVGKIYRAEMQPIFIDKDYSLIDSNTTCGLAQSFNQLALQEHEIKIRLNRFLFPKDSWDKPCCELSGGERMRILLCCLTVFSASPYLIILDEPTNNLDIQNLEILATALNEYQGTLLVVSHDETYLEQIKIGQTIALN
ncbi:ATP-binding cassette domain-containing protein [Algoriphagus sp. AGSA1]|uniref:ATP-binding cassette domain-containing protein n=1 Tax=Algoriphagus sp. AGSA1 TaxID=2907213 RepID=UPI001F46687D|nr:ATP-binding cassette domain-containing protein [Algoriphagus sp. AGSA1]